MVVVERRDDRSGRIRMVVLPNFSAMTFAVVGSGTGAVIRRLLLGRVRGFPLRARVRVTVIPFPVPAASHAACGFAALRAPAPLRGKGYEAVQLDAPDEQTVSGQLGTPRRDQVQPKP